MHRLTATWLRSSFHKTDYTVLQKRIDNRKIRLAKGVVLPELRECDLRERHAIGCVSGAELDLPQPYSLGKLLEQLSPQGIVPLDTDIEFRFLVQLPNSTLKHCYVFLTNPALSDDTVFLPAIHSGPRFLVEPIPFSKDSLCHKAIRFIVGLQR